MHEKKGKAFELNKKKNKNNNKKREKISKICTCKHHTSTESKMRRKETVSHWY